MKISDVISIQDFIFAKKKKDIAGIIDDKVRQRNNDER